MLLSELLNKMIHVGGGTKFTEASVMVKCSSCNLDQSADSMTAQVRSTWEILYECATGCGTAVILLGPGRPLSVLKGRSYVMADGWVMRNTALVTAKAGPRVRAEFDPLVTLDGHAIGDELPSPRIFVFYA
jgi:hypothetical protein